MLFDTPVYFCFLSVIVAVYWRLGWRSQNRFLLAASYFFYGWWDWRFLGLMIVSTTVDFWAGRKIGESAEHSARKRWLIVSLSVNLGFLGVFKYLGFFVQSFKNAAEMLGLHGLPLPLIQLILPAGISFYTFQEIAYIVDVYKGKQEPARSFADYALFVSLFPHLIAGPIQRPHHLLEQVRRPRRFDRTMFFDGMMLIAFGLFRKCVIADNCATLANAAFRGRLGYGFLPSFIAAFAFAFQIYGDFSGYTDIARGSAKLMGFEFVVNFRQPYLAASVRDFWRRWHISLSTWLRDYLYIPLGGNRGGRVHTLLNLLVTMLLGGLWHGANWTFIVWGGIHGFWLAVERLFTENARWPLSRPVAKAISRAATLAVVGIAWIFFRSLSIGQALHVISGFGHLAWDVSLLPALEFMCGLAILTIGMDLRLESRDEEYLFQNRPVYGLASATGLMALTVLFGATDTNAFIYFQF
ncbi:MAG: MBOAT family O-acyltransferase [Bryobacteraceae bacterium]